MIAGQLTEHLMGSHRTETARVWLLLVLPGVDLTTALDAFHTTVDLIDEEPHRHRPDAPRPGFRTSWPRANSLSPDRYR